MAEILAAHQAVERGKAQVEAAVMEFGHAAGDRVEARLQRRGDVAAAVAIKRAGALIADQRDAHHLAARRHTVEFVRVDAAVARDRAEMQRGFPLRALVAGDELAHGLPAIADDVREIAEGERQDAPAGSPGSRA